MKNLWLIVSIFCCLFTNICAINGQKTYTLLTTLYNETNEKRAFEYLFCLKKNGENPRIEQIHVLYDTSNDKKSENNIIKNFLDEHAIAYKLINGRATFQDFFTLANTLYTNKHIIIANADIYFNDTLHLLDTVDFTNLFIALTRWNIKKTGVLEIEKTYSGSINTHSQDVWMFKTPFGFLPQAQQIRLGTLDCDGGIAWAAETAGLTVINPCLSVVCQHLHMSNVRHIKRADAYQGNIMPVSACKLDIKD